MGKSRPTASNSGCRSSLGARTEASGRRSIRTRRLPYPKPPNLSFQRATFGSRCIQTFGMKHGALGNISSIRADSMEKPTAIRLRLSAQERELIGQYGCPFDDLKGQL